MPFSPHRRTLDRRALALFNVVAIGLMIVAAAEFRWHVDAIDVRRHWESHTRDMIGLGRALMADLGEVRSGLRDFEATGDASHRTRSADARARFEADLSAIRLATADNPGQLALLADVRRKADALFARLDAGDFGAIAEFEAVRPAVGRVVDEESRLLAPRAEAVARTSRRARQVGLLALIAVAPLAVDALARGFLVSVGRGMLGEEAG